MQVVFLNQFERVIGQEEERAHVFIGELQGIWSTGWRMIQQDSSSVEDLWYEGMSWEELLASFRHGVSSKLMEGFRPLLDGMLEERPFWERNPGIAQLIQCYAEMRTDESIKETVEKLRVWRRAKAIEEKKSAYLIASNRELHMLAVYLPQTLTELEQIPGFGQVKTDSYGKEIVELLGEMERTLTFPLGEWISNAVSEEQLTAWLFRMKEERYAKALVGVKEKRTLLQGIRDGRSLGELEQLFNYPRRILLEKIEQLDDEGYDVLALVEKELSGQSPEELMQIETALQELGDQYLKPLLKKVYGETQSNDAEVQKRYEKLRMMRIRHRRTDKAAIS